MPKCQTCGQELELTRAFGEKEYRFTPEGFSDLCRVLLRSDGINKDHEDALTKWLKKDRLSEKQWKFFAVIHKNALGTWPKQYWNDLKVADKNARADPPPPLKAEALSPEDDMLF